MIPRYAKRYRIQEDWKKNSRMERKAVWIYIITPEIGNNGNTPMDTSGY